MGKRTGQPLNAATEKEAAIRGDIAATRAQMTDTVSQIEERLSPSHIKEQVTDVKEHVMGELEEIKDRIRDEVKRDFDQAKHRVEQEIYEAKSRMHDATFGKVEHMVDRAGERFDEAKTTLIDTVRENPIPAAMVGLGLAWLLMGRSKATTSRGARFTSRHRGDIGVRSERYGDFGESDYGDGFYSRDYRGERENGPARVLHEGQRRVGEAIHGARDQARHLADRVQEGATQLADKTGHLVHDARDKVGTMVEGAGETIGHLAHDARDGATHLAQNAGHFAGDAGRQLWRVEQRMERGFESQLRENPLAVGAVALAVGVAVGMSLPHTEREDCLLGETKDRLFERAQGMAGEALHKAEEAAENLSFGGKKPEHHASSPS